MSTDYKIVCYDCKSVSPVFASGSISYGFKVWGIDEVKEWLGHREPCGHHENHDLRIVSEHIDLPWEYEETPKTCPRCKEQWDEAGGCRDPECPCDKS